MERKYLIYDATEDRESDLLEKNVERLMCDSVKNFLMKNVALDSKNVQITVSLESYSFTDSKGKDRIFFATHVK